MKKILLTALVLAGFSATAQVKVGDNPTTINANSILEMETTNKGLLLPRVALTGVKAAAPLSAHVEGMKVYNTATAGIAPNDVTPGEYYNDGTKWVKVSPAAPVFNPTSTVYVDVANPNSATKWGDVRYLSYDATTAGCIINPSFVDTPSLAANTNSLYVGQSTCDENNDATEYSYWIYDGTAYVPFETPESTAWYAENTTTDAGGNKDGLIRRPGSIFVGKGAITSGAIKVYGYMDTALDSFALANSNKSLYGGVNAIYHKGTNPQAGIYAGYNVAYNYATTPLANQYGSYSNTRNFGSGNVSTIYGNYNYALNDVTATGNVTSFYGYSGATNHNSPGTLTNFRGISNSTVIGADAGVPTYTYGFINAVTNSSTNAAPAGSTILSGLQSSTTNNGAAKFNSIYGGYISTTNGVNGGAFTSASALRNDFTNSATTTDAISSIYGYLSSINHTGNSPVTILRGVALSTATGSTATNGIPNTLEGINNSVLLRTTQAGSSATFNGINTTATNSSAVDVANSAGIVNSVSNAGSGITTNLRGYSSSMNNTTTGAGNTAYSSYYATMSNASATNTAAILGDYISITNTGKLSSIYNTQYSFHNSSTQANNISALFGIYSSLNTSSASNDNVVASDGIYSSNSFSSTGTATTRLSGANIILNNASTGAGTLALQQGIYASNSVNTVANITTNYGGFIYNGIGAPASGVIANNYGLRIQNTRNAGSTGSITNNYSLYIDNITTGVTGNNYAIYSASNVPSALGGSLTLGIGTTDAGGFNHITSRHNYMNLGTTRSGALVYLGRGLKADPVNGNTYVSNLETTISRTAVELGNGYISFKGQTAAESVAVDGAITAPADIMNLNALNGRVGIGTIPSSAKLHTSGSGLYDGVFRVTQTGTDGTDYWLAGTDTGWTGGGNRLLIGFGPVSTTNSKVIITQTGNIGIGMSAGSGANPTSKLQVVGLPVHADNTAATTAGLTAGAFYHAGDGIVRVVF